jgi:hypothetical protein
VELAEGAVGELADGLLLGKRVRGKLYGATEMGADSGDGVIVRAVTKEEEPMFFQKGDSLLKALGRSDAEFLRWLVKHIWDQ